MCRLFSAYKVYPNITDTPIDRPSRSERFTGQFISSSHVPVFNGHWPNLQGFPTIGRLLTTCTQVFKHPHILIHGKLKAEKEKFSSILHIKILIIIIVIIQSRDVFLEGLTLFDWIFVTFLSYEQGCITDSGDETYKNVTNIRSI